MFDDDEDDNEQKVAKIDVPKHQVLHHDIESRLIIKVLECKYK